MQVVVREDWVNQTVEPILEPGLPILDPHHHLWDLHGETYFLPQLLSDTGSGHDVRATIFVQCGAMFRASGPDAEKSLGETEFATGIAAQSASGQYGPTRAAAGIIGMVDLLLGDKVIGLLEKHTTISGGRFCGVRNRTAWHPSPEVRSNLVTPPPGPLEDPAFIDGAKRLAAFGLPLDVWGYHTQLPLVEKLARAVPELTVVIDHCGGPLGIGPFAGKRAEVFPGWKKQMETLASLPNTVVKVGGLAMQVSGHDYHHRPKPPGSEELAEAWRPYVETCIEAFGAKRCMFESNFPVDKGMCSYHVLWNALKRLSAKAGADEKTALFSGTAMKVYKLDRLPPALAIDLKPR
ncbi:MAG: amidohydrolase [Proteobacteria bacterium]|nr:amidohydrolase [Pseudomonadota bacterium]